MEVLILASSTVGGSVWHVLATEGVATCEDFFQGMKRTTNRYPLFSFDRTPLRRACKAKWGESGKQKHDVRGGVSISNGKRRRVVEAARFGGGREIPCLPRQEI